MKLLGSYRLRGNIKILVLLKFFTYIFLTWNFNSNENTFRKSLEMKYQQDGSSNISFKRLLAKHELINDSYKTYATKKYANHGMNKNIKIEAEKKRTYSQIRGGCLNNFDVYMKDYKNRYSKKKGLAKLDCYYEKNVLKKINNLYEITDNMKNKKKYYNKKIYNKYVIGLVLFSIIPFLGFIFIFYFSDLNPNMVNACFNDCRSKHEGSGGEKSADYNTAVSDHQKKSKHLLSITSDEFKIIDIVNMLFLVLSTTIVLFILLYILLKIIKYARLRAGKGKMNVKDYCHFCKDLITAK